ncbi:MAG: sphingomyelin synthase family protein [Melioribacteraceae bacterium]|nr:sphingomyelin synthase family protein [Melioribacteraceae bacterium]MCF8356780.1 sphingomyelin synthase family protein [Melioribacteraceae bacterium]MCF8396152.1 sphingomyelin synthase family protein [Melioribacteraceae bacterium]MCF8421110.1 sphingomyelin synthase family protein [Melioribacteraceae bacterium]
MNTKRFPAELKNTWSVFLSDKFNRRSFIAAILSLVVVLFLFTNFLEYVESRVGFRFTDPVLKLFSPVDLTWLTFILIYGSLVLAIIYLVERPAALMLALQTYSLMIIFRIAAMYSLPLDPPQKMIALNDPFVQFFGSGKILTKDLFFSGHTATLFILFLVSGHKYYRLTFLSAAVLVGFFVIVQHVHYTIDVIAAPFFAYCSYRIAVIFNKRKNNSC